MRSDQKTFFLKCSWNCPKWQKIYFFDDGTKFLLFSHCAGGGVSCHTPSLSQPLLPLYTPTTETIWRRRRNKILQNIFLETWRLKNGEMSHCIKVGEKRLWFQNQREKDLFQRSLPKISSKDPPKISSKDPPKIFQRIVLISFCYLWFNYFSNKTLKITYNLLSSTNVDLLG